MNAHFRPRIGASYRFYILAIVAALIVLISILSVEIQGDGRSQDPSPNPSGVVPRRAQTSGPDRTAQFGGRVDHARNHELRKARRELMILDPWGTLSDLIARRAQFDRNAWLLEIGLIIEAVEVPHRVRVEAYGQLDRSGQLIHAGDLMKSFISEQLHDEAINFYQSLPYDSSARREVSPDLWDWMMRSNSIEESLTLLRRIDDEFGDGIRFYKKHHVEKFDEVKSN